MSVESVPLETTDVLKVCRDCGEGKPRSDYHAHKRARDGLYPYCKPCSSKRNAAWRAKNAERLREYERKRPKRSAEERRRMQLWRLYKILPEDYDRLFAEQSGRCAICGTDDPGSGRELMNVDHDHETGEVRGLLCMGCNIAIGHMGDDIERLKSAIAYLERGGAG